VSTCYDQRIAVERRLLAALFLYPRDVDLEAHHFLASQHGVMFDCIRAAYREFPWVHSTGHWYDDLALAVVLGLVQQHAHDLMSWLGRSWSRPAELARFAEEYFIHVLMEQRVTAYAIDDLVEQVRACPRCGK
jgi:hypothetical protein